MPPASPLLAGSQPYGRPNFKFYGYRSAIDMEFHLILWRRASSLLFEGRERRQTLKERQCAKSDADSKLMWHINDLIADPALGNIIVKYFRGRGDQLEPSSFGKKIYRKSSSFVRKAIKVLLNGEECFARPDTMAEKDICSEEFAKHHGLSIHRQEEDKELFQIGHGKFVRSIGRVEISCALPKCPDGSTGKRWFHVIKNCPAPVIMGIEFLQKIQLYTKNRHFLVKFPSWFGNIPTLKWIGALQGNINFSADGNVLSGCADTGSDLDFMSLKCAVRNKFTIDRSDSARTLIQVGDGSKVETVGTVHISSVQLGYEFEMDFHILPGLPCDVIFNEEFVEQMDAFNTCVEIIHTEEPDLNRLNTLINLGPIQGYIALQWAKVRRKKRDIPQEESTSTLEIELYHRNRQERMRSRGNFLNTQHHPPDIIPSAPTIASTA